MQKMFLIIEFIILIISSFSIWPKRTIKKINPSVKVLRIKEEMLSSSLSERNYKRNVDYDTATFNNPSISQDGGKVVEFDYVDPKYLVFDKSILKSDEEYKMIINYKTIMSIKDGMAVLKEGDKVMFFIIMKKGVYGYKYKDAEWNYCELIDTKFWLKAGYPWLVKVHYYEKNNPVEKTRIQGHYLTNSLVCRGGTIKEYNLIIHDPEQKIDSTKPIRIGKMLFFNGKWEDSARIIDIDTKKTIKFIKKKLVVPLKLTANVGPRISFRFSRMKFQNIYHKSYVPLLRQWQYGQGYYYKQYIIKYHLPINTIENEEINTNLKTKKEIEKFIAKKYKDFGVNFKFKDFLSIKYNWKNKDELQESNNLIVDIDLKSGKRTHSFIITSDYIKAKNMKKIKKKQEKPKKEKKRSRVKREERVVEKTSKTEKKEQIFSISKNKKHSNENNKFTKNTWWKSILFKKIIKKFLNLKSMIIMSFTMLLVIYLIRKMRK